MSTLHNNFKHSVTIWQQSDKNGIGEQALVIENTDEDYISIVQEGREVLVNYETVKQLSKILKKFSGT